MVFKDFTISYGLPEFNCLLQTFRLKLHGLCVEIELSVCDVYIYLIRVICCRSLTRHTNPFYCENTGAKEWGRSLSLVR